jgi:hypothetical protein
MTSSEVWRQHRVAITDLARRALAARRVLTFSTPVTGGSLFVSATFAGSQSVATLSPPYLVEWLGPWDSLGRIWLDADLEFVDRVRRAA